MSLFEKFTDTVFLKETNSLETQINELKSIRDKVKEKDRIDRDIKLLEYGLKGENEIAFELKNANIGMYVLNDVIIECDDLKAQVDFVIVTKVYTYLVECKYLAGNVNVDSSSQFKREYEYKGKKIKEAFPSPYAQAERHKDIVMKLWHKNNGLLKTLLFEKLVKKRYKPLVVLANSKGILNTKYAPKNIRNCTIRVDNLISYIKRDIDTYDKYSYFNRKLMYKIAYGFLNDKEDVRDYSKKYTFIENIQNVSNDEQTVREDLIKRLKEFRKKRAKEKNIPAYYVFTDEELSKLVSSDIKTLEELRNCNILSDVKVNSHGEEIVKIINEFKF